MPKEVIKISIPLEVPHYDAVVRASTCEIRTVASYVRTLILADLQRRGYIDNNYEPTGK